MGGPYLVDTNVFIDLFKGRLSKEAGLWAERLLNTEVYYISSINRIELLGYDSDEKESEYLELVVNQAIILEISREVEDATIALRRTRKIKLPDAIVAATAKVHRLVILTRNTKDFDGIEGVMTKDPHDVV